MAWVSYAFLRGLFGVFQIMPLSLSLALGRTLGSLLFLVDGRHREIARRNIAQAFPEKTDTEHRRMARASFRHFAQSMVESLVAERYFNKERWEEFVEASELKKAREILDRGKGLICIGPHLGSWEIGGHTLGLSGLGVRIIGRPLKNPHLQRYLIRTRERTGIKVLPRRGGFREFFRHLQGGGAVVLMPDQNQRKRPLFVDFFGRAAATDRSLAYLAGKTKAPVVFMALIRQDNRFRFRVETRAFDEAPPSRDSEEEQARYTRAMHGVLEKFIREYPEQYFWLHDRFRTRPEAETVQA